jgi:two-component system, OmpR family, osmolarity sensor histidine kinase EnvZ
VKLPSPSLFWRTFLLILLLIVASLLAWLQSFRAFEREPRAQQIANEVVSIVNITRSALLYSDSAERRQLLADLVENVGIRVVPLEPADQVLPLPDRPVPHLVGEKVRDLLGQSTRVGGEVNGVPGIWVSFDIEGDGYWVYIERDLLTRDIGTQWIGWAVVATLLSLLATVAITRVVNRPLQQLSRAARELGAGHRPAALPETGPTEIRTVNRSFNRMVGDLGKLEQDRAVLLAGISHDLRTPLTRLRLEIEINDLPAETRQAMIGDLEQMDAIVGQFLDYARARPQEPAKRLDLSQLVDDTITQSRIDIRPDVTLTRTITPGIVIDGHTTELQRAVMNLLTNAERYGRDGSGRLQLDISLQRSGAEAVLAIADHGPGIAPERVDQLMRPFERGDAARGSAKGAGLGLAIVERIAVMHGGRFRIGDNGVSGLRAELRLPASRG